MTIGIYKILNKVTGKFYIGSSNNIEYRFRQHKANLRHGYHNNSYLQAAWDKYGETNFEFIVEQKLDTIDRLLEVEDEWIEKTSCCNREIGYNLQLKSTGTRHSEETLTKIRSKRNAYVYTDYHRQQISKSLMGNKRTLGHKLSEEHKQKIAQAGIGRTPTEATREKLRIANTGKKASAETKKKLSLSHMGNKSRQKYTEEQIQSILTEFNSGVTKTELSRKYNIPGSSMHWLIQKHGT